MDVHFHCDETQNFPEGIDIRAFAYRNYRIRLHSHDFYEVNIVMEGTGIHCISSGEIPVKTGNVFVIPPLAAHAYKNTKNLTVYHILLRREFVERNWQEGSGVPGFLQLMEIEPFLRDSARGMCFLRLNQLQMLQLSAELAFLDEQGQSSAMGVQALKAHSVWRLLYWLSGLLYEQLRLPEDTGQKKHEREVIRVMEYIHRNYSEKITLEELCGHAHLSRSTLLRSFGEVCGTSPTVYLNRYRCKKAKELFVSAQSTKTEIAYNCGFYDLSHMERMLKKYG